MDDEALGQLLGMEAETLGYPGVDVEITPELERVLERYQSDLADTLQRFVARESHWPPDQVEEYVDGLMDEGNAPLNVLLTLRGEGVGIWDGRWDEYFKPEELKRLQALLARRMGHYADPTGGGSLNEAMRNAILVSVGEAPPSNGHTEPKGMCANPRLLSDQQITEYWQFDHRRPPESLDTGEAYVRAVKFVVQTRPRKYDAVLRDIRRLDPGAFDQNFIEFLLEDLDRLGYIEQFPSKKSPTDYYVRRARGVLQPNPADVVARAFGRETGFVPHSPEAEAYLRDALSLDYDRWHGAYMAYEDEVDDVVLALRMRGHDVLVESRPGPGPGLMLLRPPLVANGRRRRRRSDDKQSDVVVWYLEDEIKVVPRSEHADQYIAERLSLGDKYDEIIGGYTASPVDMNEIVAALEAAHFDVAVEDANVA